MPEQGRPGYLKYRVLDSNTGAIISPDLWHLKQSTWTIRAPQGGMPGSSTIGEFTFRLPPPQSEAGKANAAVYNALAVGQKVEAYIGDVITGNPKFTGVITKMNKPLAAPWEIIGADTLWWLQQSQLFIGEKLGYASGTPAQIMVRPFLGTREVVWDDDFSVWGTSGHPNSTDYFMLNAGFYNGSTDPMYGLSALVCNPTAAENRLRTNTAWAIGQQFSGDFGIAAGAGCSIKVQGVVQPSGTMAVGQGVELGVMALANPANSQAVLGRAWVRQTALAPFYIWAIDAEIWTSDAAGTWTSRASVANVFSYNAQGNSTPTIPLEVEMTMNTGERCVRVIVNGQDSDCTTPIDNTIMAASGGIGLRNTASGGTPRVYYNRLRFESRTSAAIGATWGVDRFPQAVPGLGASKVMAPAVFTGNQQSHLDMILMGASFDGNQIRKNPGPGPKADSIDYAPSLGADLTRTIVFEEGVNVRDEGTLIAPLADLFSHATRVNAIPGVGGSGGQITSAPLQAAGSMVLLDSISDLGLSNYQILTAYARIVAARKANIMQAIQVEVFRTSATADKWRELDFVTIHIPTLGIFRQRAQILGYTFHEGSATQTLYLNQYPDASLIHQSIDRLIRCLEFIGTTYQKR